MTKEGASAKRWARWTLAISGGIVGLLVIAAISLYLLARYDIRYAIGKEAALKFRGIGLSPAPRFIFKIYDSTAATYSLGRVGWYLNPFRELEAEESLTNGQ